MSNLRYRLLAPFTFNIPELAYGNPNDLKVVVLGYAIYVSDGTITLIDNYAIDGCTIVPDGDPIEKMPEGFFAEAIYPDDCIRSSTPAAFGHDGGYQYGREIAKASGIPSRKVRRAFDHWFKDRLVIDGFGWAKVYGFFVRIVGWPWFYT